MFRTMMPSKDLFRIVLPVFLLELMGVAVARTQDVRVFDVYPGPQGIGVGPDGRAVVTSTSGIGKFEPNGAVTALVAGLKNVEAQISVTDTLTGGSTIYANSSGARFQPVQDTGSFPCR